MLNQAKNTASLFDELLVNRPTVTYPDDLNDQNRNPYSINNPILTNSNAIRVLASNELLTPSGMRIFIKLLDGLENSWNHLSSKLSQFSSS